MTPFPSTRKAKKPDHIGLFDNILTQNPRPKSQEQSESKSRKLRDLSPRLLPRVASTPPAQGPYSPKPTSPVGCSVVSASGAPPWPGGEPHSLHSKRGESPARPPRL